MANAKRWNVTYTKHIKQKRKVYQDGFLELHDSTTKVMLYDECDKLLECRLLKKDEIVTSGESLTFNGYLVDIGDPEGGNIPVSDTNEDRIDKNIARRPNSAEFKKRELLKYGSPKISPETGPSTSEWQVLYTTQVTQKAKKYHDGFLQLVIYGSRGKQVTLFDASRKLLDSRFLMKNDIIRAGESLAFDAYLVDIGEKQGNHDPDSSVQGDKCTDAEGIRKMQRQRNSLDTHVTARSEWQVVYAARSTKKIKKYLDGFLQMAILGSQERQVVLCDLSKTPVERRFLKKDEVIRPGQSLYFDGHLVDVGEPEGSHQSPINLDEESPDNNVLQRRQISQGRNGSLGANSFVVKGKPPSKADLARESDLNSLLSGSDVIKSNRIIPPIKPLRDSTYIVLIILSSFV
ncbi:uncharacterized protein G2W53_019279 [Senna tora]|uniref:5'-3' DNA helicase ZGRF1-like N-terminal domain-containing protein n=1 Tax=Senna tora TaxID=362788 RepID=A0A834TXJ1_9FABA|nr:uncharacterized protein G2W53_019279 [Senna tora]